MSQYSKSEIKVGFFVMISVLVFLFILFMMGSFRSTSGTYPVKLRFNFISGLQKGAPVRYAGAMAGKVEKVSILSTDEESNIEVLISVAKPIRLKEDTQARIDTLGLMGEKYVELSPGKDSSPELKAGASLLGSDPLAMHLVYEKMMTIADKVDENLDVMEKLLDNSNSMVAENRIAIQETITNLRDISTDAKAMAADLKEHPWKLFWKGKEKKNEGLSKTNDGATPRPRAKFLGIF